MRFFIGLDLGQLSDFTAIAIAERVMAIPQKPAALPWQSGHLLYDLAHTLVDQPLSPPIPKASYRLRHLQRYPLRTSYPAIVASIKQLVSRPELQSLEEPEEVVLAVDHTGVGVAVFDMLQEADLPCLLYGVTIHGGSEVTQDGLRYHVPKRDLITLTQVLLQNERFKIAEALPEAKTLTKELLNYRLKIDPVTAHDSYNAREGAHDDLVLAVSLACWIGEETGGHEPRARWVSRRCGSNHAAHSCHRYLWRRLRGESLFFSVRMTALSLRMTDIPRAPIWTDACSWLITARSCCTPSTPHSTNFVASASCVSWTWPLSNSSAVATTKSGCRKS